MYHCSTEVFPTQNSLCWFSGACASSIWEVWEGDRNIGWTAEQKQSSSHQINRNSTAGETPSFPLKSKLCWTCPSFIMAANFRGSTEKPAPKNCVWELDINREHWKIFLPLPGTQGSLESTRLGFAAPQNTEPNPRAEFYWVLLSSLHQLQWKWANLDFSGLNPVVPGCQAGLQLTRENAVSDRTQCTSFDRSCQIYGWLGNLKSPAELL